MKRKTLPYYKFIFVVLVYRSHDDLKDFYTSICLHFSSFKIIIVNSFFDEESKAQIDNFAKRHNCDFLNVENRGYGYGNNRGIEHVKSNYDYDFIIIANPDTIVNKMDFSFSDFSYREVLIAPNILTSTGKKQNPYWVLKNLIAEHLIYMGYKYCNKCLIYFGIAINKIIREVFLMTHRKRIGKIYAAHGSFMFISKKVIVRLKVLFDENMFLFAEEAMLAHVLEKHGISILYIPTIEILHKEDGSVKLAKINETSITRDSVIYYYEKYVLRKD